MRLHQRAQVRAVDAYRELQQDLRRRITDSAVRLIRSDTALVVTYGGGPANQYGLQSSGEAIATELTARGVPAIQIAANSPRGFEELADLDPARVKVWITDPYR